MPMPPLTHSVASPRTRRAAASRAASVTTMRAPVAPIGWPRAMAPPLTLSFSRRDRLVAQHREHLRGERLVQLHEVEILRSSARPREQLAMAGTGPMPMMPRVDAGEAHPVIARAASTPEFGAHAAGISTSAAPPSVMPDDVPGRDDAGVALDVGNTSGSFASASIVVPAADARRSTVDVLPLALLDRHRRDLVVEPSPADARLGLLLALERVGVRLLARDAVLARQHLRGFAHDHPAERTL
jgi:hypothetical protein